MSRWPPLQLVAAGVALLGQPAGLCAADAAPEAPGWSLHETCPASFEKTPDGKCAFVSLYQLYFSPEGHGGQRAALPPMRAAYSPRQIDLGRYLFFDPLLSGDQRTSCAHCHHPDFGYADGRGRSMGSGGRGIGPARTGGAGLPRSAPGLWNVGFLQRLFWDGRAFSLEQQALGPLFAADEMGNTAESLTRSLDGIEAYRSLFALAFERDAARPISVDEVAQALAAFQTSLVSFNSRYDRYAHGDEGALSAQEIAGYNVFRGFVARCSQCHVPPLFTDGELAVIGAPAVPGQEYDLGAATQEATAGLRGGFKVPTLRNVARTAPYFHAGQLADLREVVRFYNDRRGHAVPPGAADLHIHWHIPMARPMLSDAEVDAVVAFLGTLTDESMSPPVPAAVPSGLQVVPVRSAEPAAHPPR